MSICSFIRIDPPPCGHQAARCDCCKVQGNLTESVMWRAEMKHFCDQECLLKFYSQQNEPILVTQKGPENTMGMKTGKRLLLHLSPRLHGPKM